MKRPNVINRLGKNKPSFRYEMLHKAEINNILKYIDHLEARIKELEEGKEKIAVIASEDDIKKWQKNQKNKLGSLSYNKEKGEYEFSRSKNHTSLTLLPSDGEIEKEGQKRFDETHDVFYVESFYEGVSWLKSQMKSIPTELSDDDAEAIYFRLNGSQNIRRIKSCYNSIIQHFKEKP